MVVTLTSDAQPKEQLRAVVGAVREVPRTGDPANVIVVPDLASLTNSTLRALCLLFEDPAPHVRICRDPLALQHLTEEEVRAELNRRPAW